MSKKFQVVLVRHGETSYNKMRVIQGQLDVPLNELGKAQALAAGDLLSNTKFSFAYSSDLQRASETCKLLLSRNFAFEDKRNPSIVFDARLRERTFGCMEGKPVSDMVNAAKKANKSMLHYVAEGGETLNELKDRARSFFESLCEKMYEEISSVEYKNEDIVVLLVSHGGFIKALFSTWIENNGCNDGDSNNSSFNVVVGNASHSSITVNLLEAESALGDNVKNLQISSSVSCTSFNIIPKIESPSNFA